MRETMKRAAYQKSMTDPVVFESDKEDAIRVTTVIAIKEKSMATREMGRAGVRMREKRTREKMTGMVNTTTRKARIMARWETSGLGNLTTKTLFQPSYFLADAIFRGG